MLGEALAAAAERLGPDAHRVLARLGGPLGDAARAAAEQLAALEPVTRRRRRIEAAVRARSPVPAGIRGVHASWIEAGLARLPTRAREALATGGGDPAAVWLVRRACAELTALTAPRAASAASAPSAPSAPSAASAPSAPSAPSAGVRARDRAQPVPPLEDVIARDPEVLVAWLRDIGLDQLACAVRRAGPAATEAAIARFGPALRHALERIDEPPRAGQLGPMRAVLARCADGGPGEPGELTLLRIGARAIAPHVARHPLAARQLVLRLDRPRGLVVHAELWQHAGDAVEAAPAWAALAA